MSLITTLHLDPESEEARRVVKQMEELPELAEAVALLETRDKGLASLGKAILSSYKVAGLGLSVGVLFVVLHHQLEQSFSYAFLLKDIGLGFIVSSLAVVAYEWRSHLKKAHDLSWLLLNAIKTISKTTNSLVETKSLLNIIEEQKELKKQLEEASLIQAEELSKKKYEGLKQINLELAEFRNEKLLHVCDKTLQKLLVSEPNKDSLQKNIYKLIESAYALKTKQTADTIQYIDAINWLLENVVVKNAESLVHVSEKTFSSWDFSVPENTARMAAKVLAAQMNVLQKGDSYDSISDILFWKRKRMDVFLKATEATVTDKEAKRIRRIFTVCRLEDEERANFLERHADVIKDILEEHYKLVKKSNGNYEIKFLSKVEAKEVESDTSRNDVQSITFGIFKMTQGFVRFVAKDNELSRLRLGYCNRDDPDVDLFESMWLHASDEIPTFLTQRIGNVKKSVLSAQDLL